MKMRNITGFASIVIILSSVSLFSGTLTREYNKTVPFREGGTIELKNTNGKAVIRSWNRDEVKIYAEIKVRCGDRREAEQFMERVEINVREQGDCLSITTDYPKKNFGNIFGWLFGKSISVSIAFEIIVPARSNLDLDLVNGSLEVEDVEGESVLETTNGAIKARDLRGMIKAHSTNGSITASLLALDKDRAASLSTTNGAIKLTIPKYVEADLDAKVVNGRIHSDFDLDVKGRFNSRSVRGRINGGGTMIDLHSVNGSISIYGD